MEEPDDLEPQAFDDVPDALRPGLTRRGFEALTAVQRAVLRAPADRDLRIQSRTGSGKTVALGLALGRMFLGLPPKERAPSPGIAQPRALVVAPTRELAVQVARELTWLLAPVVRRIAVVTGGRSFDLDARALGSDPDVVVGTPGRLIDHATRGALNLSTVRALVLDEADAMLDLGFRDELDQILERLPADRRTHLVSATFADEILRLAERHQRDALEVEGEGVGVQHADIEHRGLLMRLDDRPAALVNLLLATPGERTLVFVRTRADASEVADGLLRKGFAARAISGELTQRERSTTLESFRSGEIPILVATDVAARGLDVDDVARVVHYDLPGSPDTLTHRSGRTGRAGKHGENVLFVPAQMRAKAGRLLTAAGIRASLVSLPPPDEVQRALELRVLSTLEASPDVAEGAPFAEAARAILASPRAHAMLTALVSSSRLAGPCAPMAVAVLDPRGAGPARPARDAQRPPTRPPPRDRTYVRFQVSWGGANGADPRRILAVTCKRGDIASEHVGAIEILPKSSSVEIAAEVADHFARNALETNPSEPGLRFRLHKDQPRPARGPERPGPRPRGHAGRPRPRA